MVPWFWRFFTFSCLVSKNVYSSQGIQWCESFGPPKPLILGPQILIIFHFFHVWCLKMSNRVREYNRVDHLDRQYPLIFWPLILIIFHFRYVFSFQDENFKWDPITDHIIEYTNFKFEYLKKKFIFSKKTSFHQKKKTSF